MTTKSQNDMQPQPTMSRTRTSTRGQQQGQGQQPQAQTPRAAWEDFLDGLKPALEQAGDHVRVQDRAGWVKIESPTTGHKVYFNKGVTGVTRVESSLPPSAVKGAEEPEFYNGRIASVIPPTVEAVSEAILVVAQTQERLAPPRRRTRDIA